MAVLVVAALVAVLLATYAEQPRNACPNVEPGVTPSAVLATACPAQYHAQEQRPSNGYLRPAPQADAPGWVELALPTGRWLIHSNECMLSPWVVVLYHTSAPNVAGVNDCALDAWIAQSNTPCAQDERGACDLTLDQSYQDWLAESP